MATTIEIPGEGVTVTATCPRCHEPMSRPGGSVSWACDNSACETRVVPMWEDARFVDPTGREWIVTDDGDWVDVVDDAPPVDVDEIVAGYVEAALWADARDDSDPDDEPGGKNGTHEAHEDDVRALRERIAEWVEGIGADAAAFDAAMIDRVGDWTTAEQMGHDLRLTAEGHGAGFWDRGLGALGDRLTAHAKAFGTFDCWVDDSGVTTNGCPTVRFDV